MPCREEKETTPESPQESRRPRRRRGHARLTYPRATQGPPPQRARGAPGQPFPGNGGAIMASRPRSPEPLVFVLLINYLSLLGAVGLISARHRGGRRRARANLRWPQVLRWLLHFTRECWKGRNASQPGRQAAARIKFRCSAGAFDYLLSP
jgi:hypothetical protein